MVGRWFFFWRLSLFSFFFKMKFQRLDRYPWKRKGQVSSHAKYAMQNVTGLNQPLYLFFPSLSKERFPTVSSIIPNIKNFSTKVDISKFTVFSDLQTRLFPPVFRKKNTLKLQKLHHSHHSHRRLARKALGQSLESIGSEAVSEIDDLWWTRSEIECWTFVFLFGIFF